MINLHGVRKTYPPEQVALQGIDLKVFPGDFLFIVGASGAGKSTLLRLLFGAEQATAGQVVVGGRNLSTISRDGVALLRREMGFVFQDYKLLPRRTVAENVAFGLEVQGIRQSNSRALALDMLDAMNLRDKADVSPLTLSGGEQQRVAIARALVTKPRLLLADEPTGNLDSEMTSVVFDLLVEANRSGLTVVVATHDLSIIEELNRRAIVLDKGRIIGDFENPRGVRA